MDQTVITILLGIFIVLAIAALIYVIKVLSHVTVLVDSLNETSVEATKAIVELRDASVPIIKKTDITMDAVNAELMRIDGIISSFEETSERVSSVGETISGIVNAPTEIVTGLTDRFIHSWRVKRAVKNNKKGLQSNPNVLNAPTSKPKSGYYQVGIEAGEGMAGGAPKES
ncbi:MAG: hypothetical protein JJE36_00435 [Coriobacteriia bacterium]|nr:hypothetical protein [Coriobacteriia bacterium]